MQLYIGMSGSALCIIALALTMFKRGFGETINYKLLNLFGGACLFYYAVVERSIPFIILEGTWTLIPLVSLCSIFLDNRRAK